MSQTGQKESAALPTGPLSFRIPPYRLDMHRHDEGHAVYVHRGRMALVLTDSAWAVLGPSLCWVPAGCLHGGGSLDSFTGATFWQSELRIPEFPQKPCRIQVPPELLASGVSFPSRGKIRALVRDLLQARVTTDFALAVPRSPALHQLATEMLVKPGVPYNLTTAAAMVNMPRRSFTRRFRRETGLSFGEWRLALLTHLADEHFRESASVSAVAHQLGYNSVSAFVAMYRQIRGHTLTRSRLPARL